MNTRRQLIGTGTAAAAVTLAACGAKKSAQHHQPGQPMTPADGADVKIMNHLLDVERRGIAAYSAGIPLLPRSVVKDAQQFLNQELAHAGELISLVRKAGGKPHKLAASYDLGHPRSGDDVLALLHEVEGEQIVAYLDWIPRVASGKRRAALLSILANDAQHISLVRAALGRPPVPSAFVTARE